MSGTETVPWPVVFSTLGCPGRPLEEAAALARKHGLAGIELRAHPGDPLHAGIGAGDRKRIRDAVAGLDVPLIATYVRLADDTVSTAEVVEDAVRHVALAEDLDVGAIRLFTGGSGGPGTVERARDRFERTLTATEDSPVRLLLETHDHLLTGEDVAKVLADLPERAGAVWDVLNPWRSGESPARTAAALRGRVGHLQFKDTSGPDSIEPVIPGSGAVPLDRVLAALDADGWQGHVSLEWERAWYPHIPPLDVVLPAAVRWLETSWRSTRSGGTACVR